MDTNLEAEYMLLGSILKKGELFKETTLEEKHFFVKSHQTLFSVFKKIDRNNEQIDVATVVLNLGSKKLASIGGKKFLSKLMNSVPSLEPFKTYERYIKDAWKVREARMIQSKDINELGDISKIVHAYAELDVEANDDDYDHAASLQKIYQDIENQEPGLSGIDTGFKDINAMLDGFQNGDLIISAARPSVGKTAKMLNHAIAHCESGGLSAIFSLEMGEESLNKRLLSTIGRINGYKMKNPKDYFDSRDWSYFTDAMGLLSNMNIHIYDKAGQTVSYIRSKVRKLKRQYPETPILVMIDYLQMMRPDKRMENKNIEIGEITRSLKELAKESDIPVYLLSQLSRDVEKRQNKRPGMSDIRDSGSVEQDADVIEFLYRDDYYELNPENRNIIEVIIAKQRNGPVGTVELAYRKEYNLFLDLE